MIFDGHAYCIPPLRENGGFEDPGALRRHLQQAMATHHQPPWRVRDGAPGDNGDLMDLGRWPDLDAVKEAEFRVASHGRFEWTVGGEAYAKQYFPPSIVDMSYPPDRLVAEMDYAGVGRTLLHRTPYLGVGNEFTASCVPAFPGPAAGPCPRRRVADRGRPRCGRKEGGGGSQRPGAVGAPVPATPAQPVRLPRPLGRAGLHSVLGRCGRLEDTGVLLAEGAGGPSRWKATCAR